MSHYSGRLAALATQHGKEIVIAPAFANISGINVIRVAIDTDQFGTFAGEVERSLSPKETAIIKARTGMKFQNLCLGLASEGSIGPHPVSGITTVDTELMVFIDDERELVITEKVQSFDIVAQNVTAHLQQDISGFLRRADFPRHALLVRTEQALTYPASESVETTITKGITDLPTLLAAMKKHSAHSERVIIENDFRAHFSPSRMAVIGQCAELLAKRVAAPCPDCSAPGWGSIEPLRGLGCADCGTTVDWVIHADRSGCQKCELIHIHPRPIQAAEPRWCNTCNP
jgi:hypothetical protein